MTAMINISHDAIGQSGVDSTLATNSNPGVDIKMREEKLIGFFPSFGMKECKAEISQPLQSAQPMS